MISDRIEGKWIELFAEVFAKCKVGAGDACAVLSETQSRALNVQLADAVTSDHDTSLENWSQEGPVQGRRT